MFYILYLRWKCYFSTLFLATQDSLTALVKGTVSLWYGDIMLRPVGSFNFGCIFVASFWIQGTQEQRIGWVWHIQHTVSKKVFSLGTLVLIVEWDPSYQWLSPSIHLLFIGWPTFKREFKRYHIPSPLISLGVFFSQCAFSCKMCHSHSAVAGKIGFLYFEQRFQYFGMLCPLFERFYLYMMKHHSV